MRDQDLSGKVIPYICLELYEQSQIGNTWKEK